MFSDIKYSNYSTRYIKFSILSLLISIGTIFLYINFENHWQATLYVIILFFVTFIPGLIISKKHKSPWIALLLNPALIFSFDAFFLRLGFFNYFIYMEGYWHPAATQNVIQKAAVLTVLSNVALWIGYFLPSGKWVKYFLGKYFLSWTLTRVKFSEVRVWILFSIGIFARLYTLGNLLGGFFSFDLSELSEALEYNQLFVLLESLAPLSLIVYFVFLLDQGKMARWPKFVVMLGIELFTVFLMGFKGQVIYRTIYMAISYAFYKNKFPYQLVLLGIVILIVIMPVNLLMREDYITGRSKIQSGEGVSIIEGAREAFSDILKGGTEYTFISVPERIIRQSAQLENFSMAIQYVDRTNNILNGRELLNFIYGFVPRALWSSKQIAPLGNWFYQEVYGYTGNTAAAITVPGDLYLNLNWWGLIIGMFLYGAIIRIIYEFMFLSDPSLRMASLVPFIIFGLGIPVSEIGSHLNGFVRLIFLYTIVISVYLLPKIKKTH